MKNNKSLKVLSTAAIAAALVAPTVAVQPAFAASTYSVTGTQNVSADSTIPGTTRVTVEVSPGSLGTEPKTLYMRLPADARATVNGVGKGVTKPPFEKSASATQGVEQKHKITFGGTATGVGKVEIKVNGKDIKVDVNDGDVAKDIASKVATEINSASTGFTADSSSNDGVILLTAKKADNQIDNLVEKVSIADGVTFSEAVEKKGVPASDGKEGSEFVPAKVSGDENQIQSVEVISDSSDDQYFTIKVKADPKASANRGIFFLDLTDVKVPSGAPSGPFNVTFDSQDNAFSPGDVKIAQVGHGSVKTSIDGTVALAPGKNDKVTLKTIRIQEDAAKAFDGEYKLELPDGFKWYGDDIKGKAYWGDDQVDLVFDSRGKDTDTLTFKVVAKGKTFNDEKKLTTKATQFTIDGLKVKADDSDAAKGEVKVKIKGDVSRTNDSIVIGTYGNYEGDVKAGDAKTVYAGQTGEELATFTIKEDTPDTLREGRTLKLKLTGNAKWATKRVGNKVELKEQPQIKSADSEKNGLELDTWELSGSDRTVIQTTVKKHSTNKPAKIVLEKLKVDVAPTAGKGDISVALEGTSGVTADAVILGKTAAPVEISVDGELAKIDAGLQQQSIPNITIKEVAADLIDEKDLVVKFPEGVKPTLPGKVEVTGGNLKIDSAKISVEDNKIIIPISKHSSDKGATIKLSDIKVTSYRYVPEGDLKVKITGPAVVQNIKDGESNDYPFNKPNDTHVVEGSVAKVVTPADKNKYAENIVFKIGSKTYTQDGKEMTMDVAPEVHPVYNRTYIPAAHFAASLNIPADKVVWNEASKTVTIFAGDKVVSATAGKKELVVNGTPVQIDAPVNYGQHTGYRVMVPYTHLALALGATVEWKADTQEIFVNKR